MLSIGVDLNDTLANTRKAKWRAVIEATHGRLNIPFENFAGERQAVLGQAYRMENERGFGSVSGTDYDRAMKILFEDRFIDLTEPMPGALAAIQALQAAGHSVTIVSQVRKLEQHRLEAWLSRHGFAINDIVLTHGGSKDADFNCCDAAIDDKPQCLQGVDPNVLKICLLARLNEGVPAPKVGSNIRLARSWDEAHVLLAMRRAA